MKYTLTIHYDCRGKPWPSHIPDCLALAEAAEGSYPIVFEFSNIAGPIQLITLETILLIQEASKPTALPTAAKAVFLGVEFTPESMELKGTVLWVKQDSFLRIDDNTIRSVCWKLQSLTVNQVTQVGVTAGGSVKLLTFSDLEEARGKLDVEEIKQGTGAPASGKKTPKGTRSRRKAAPEKN